MERFAIKIDEDGPLNLCKMCRLCGTINTGKIPILQNNVFFMEDGDPELWKKIFACVGIQVSKDDKMPQNVCALCHDKILDFYEFREMCISIDLQTRKMLGLPSIEVKKIEDHLVQIYKKQKTLSQKRKTTEQKCLSTSSIKQSKLMKIENNSIFGNNLEMKKNAKNHTLVNMIKDEDISSSSTANLKKRKASSTLQINKNKKQMVDVKSEIYYDKRKSRKCNICAQIIAIPKFDEHLRTIHVPRIVPYHCVRCDETISKKPEIKNHNLWHKLSRTPYTCGRCNKNVETLVGYTRHINDCLTLDKGNNFKKQTIKCPNCSKSFIKSSNATRHIIRCKIKYENITETVIKQENSIDKAFTENNACVLIPSSITNIRTSTSSSSLPSTNIESLNDKYKKSRKLTKKDMQRFDDLLKNTYETLQSIKQEPKDNQITDADTVKNISNTVTGMEAKASDSNTEEIEKNSYDDNVDDGINRDNNDDYYSSDNNDNDDVGNGLPIPLNIKQEDLEIHDTEFEKDINESTTNNTTLPSTSDAEINTTDADKQQPQPTIKLKIKKEHGTLNSLIVGDSNNCEDINSKKKKRKKKKSGDKDSSENETMENIKQEPLDDDDEDEQQETNIENNLPNDDDPSLSNSNNNSVTVPAVTSSFVGESGVIKLPIISSVHSGIRIKQEIPDDFENLRVVIKQEKPDESYENLSGMMEVNDADRNNSVLSVPNPDSNNLRLEGNNLTVTEQAQEPSPATVSSNNTINNTESNTINQATRLFNMGTVQIKREIINEDYTNPIGECDDNDEHIRRMISSVVVKQEVQTNYDNVNNEINNGSESNVTTANLRLNQCDSMFDPNIAANIKKEKNDETNSNSELRRPAPNTNVFQFKKIVLRTSSISNEPDNENCSDKLEQENNAANVEDSTVNNQSEKQDNENQENTEKETEITKQSCSENNNGNDAGDELVTKSNDCGSNSEERITKAADDDAGGELVTKSNDWGSSSEEQITKEAGDDDDDVGDKPDEDLMSNKENCIREEIISNINDLEMTENDSKQQNESESEIMNDHQSSTELKIDSKNDKLSESDEISDDNLVEMKDSVEKNTEIPKNEIPEITIASVLCGSQVDELLKTDEDDDVIEIKDEELLKTNEEIIEIEDDDDDEELENEDQEVIEQENEEQEVIEQEDVEEENEKAEQKEEKLEQEKLKEIEDSNKKLNVEQQQCDNDDISPIFSNKKLNVEQQQCDNDDISPILDCTENPSLPSTSHDFELNYSNLTKNIESETDVNIKIPIESIVVKKERFNYEEIIEIESDDDIENNSQQIETICSVIKNDVVANNLNENKLKLFDDNNSVDTNNDNETALKDTVIASDIEISPLESDETDKNETLEVEQTTIVAATTIATSTTITDADADVAAMAATSTTNSSNLSIIPITTEHLENDNLETHSVVTTNTPSTSLPIIDDNVNEIAENNSENIEKELMNNDVDNDDELEEYDDSLK